MVSHAIRTFTSLFSIDFKFSRELVSRKDMELAYCISSHIDVYFPHVTALVFFWPIWPSSKRSQKTFKKQAERFSFFSHSIKHLTWQEQYNFEYAKMDTRGWQLFLNNARNFIKRATYSSSRSHTRSVFRDVDVVPDTTHKSANMFQATPFHAPSGSHFPRRSVVILASR